MKGATLTQSVFQDDIMEIYCECGVKIRVSGYVTGNTVKCIHCGRTHCLRYDKIVQV